MSVTWRWVGAGMVGVVTLLTAWTVVAQTEPAKSGDTSTAKQSQETKRPARKTKAAKKAGAAAGFSPPPPGAAEAGVPVLSSGDSYDDFPCVAQARDGTLYALYAAYYDGNDQIRIHKRLPGGRWSTRSYVPLAEARADIWMPQLAVDAKDRLWVVWCEQTGRGRAQTGNWDLYARSLVGEEWGPLVRLSEDSRPDINPHVATDPAGTVYVVWQAHPQNSGEIMLRRLEGDLWSEPVKVTSGAKSDWYPQVAVDSNGTAWVAFDSYRNGDYDVFLASVRGRQVGEITPIATSRYYEAHPSVACTPDGRVWVAWEQGGYNWGKDQGYWLRVEKRLAGTALGSTRSLRVAVYDHGKVLAAPAVSDALPAGERQSQNAMASLAADREGRLWLRFRHQKLAGGGVNGRRYWTEQVTTLTEKGWKPASELAASAGRISVFSRILPLADGTLAVAYSSDGRTPDNFHQPIRDQVLVAMVPKPEGRPGSPELRAYEPPNPPGDLKAWDAERERSQVGAIRDYHADIGGRPHQIVRGDLHRHTEMSWDVGPGNDGSYLDFYRYMIDVAAMDFGSLTDHQGGGHYAYWWWLTEKSADMYYLPPRFVPLYGYERSVVFPNGHRNVLHSYRGVPVFPFQLKLTQTGVFPGVGTGEVMENDTKLLYQYLRKTGGLAISHTSGTRMGTDWRDNDPGIEPVVEIYQGARNSYEALGGPRVHNPDKIQGDAPGEFRPIGMVWNAYAKGYRLGTITSSDHGSTHISYALVYTPQKDRAAILESIRKRQTYGATDNLIVDFRANGHFMGEEFSTAEKPNLVLRARGTDALAKIDLIRNNEYVYSAQPDTAEVEIKYEDTHPRAGTNLYYFRLLQQDGEVAWTSPVWVNYGGK